MVSSISAHLFTYIDVSEVSKSWSLHFIAINRMNTVLLDINDIITFIGILFQIGKHVYMYTQTEIQLN